MKKLILFDIDGTIVTEGYQGRIIPDSFYETLHALQEKGHLCFINTGRAFSEVGDEIRSLGFDGYICGCGTYILYHNKELFAKTFPYTLGNDIIETIEQAQLEWILEGQKDVYYGDFDYMTHIGDFKKEHLSLMPEHSIILKKEERKNIPFDKFCICIGKDSNFELFHQKFKEDLAFIDRGNGLYEVMPIDCSKASGIRFLEEHFGIAHEDTIAIGDSANDLAMLSYAGYSIAMGNSSKEILPVVDYVTTDILDDGIYHAMKHLHLI